jgi:hypothetical protein
MNVIPSLLFFQISKEEMMSTVTKAKAPKSLSAISLQALGIPEAYVREWTGAGYANNLKVAYDVLCDPTLFVERVDGAWESDLSVTGISVEASNFIEKKLLAYEGRPKEVDETFGAPQVGENAVENPDVVTPEEPTFGILLGDLLKGNFKKFREDASRVK